MSILKALARAFSFYALISAVLASAVGVITAPWWVGFMIWSSYHQPDRDCTVKSTSAYTQPKNAVTI